MRAMLITEFGGPDVFREGEVPTPEPGPNELLVRVHATSVNPVDLAIREHGGGRGIEPPAIIGYDVSGVVEAIGPGVEHLTVGDPVYYSPETTADSGSYAEYHVARETIVATKPDNLTHNEAASLPLVACTAWDALVVRELIWAGRTVLIHGAGGVGSAAIQVARAAGTRVLAICAPYMVDVAQELGAEIALPYNQDDWQDAILDETDGVGVDVVLDTVGGDTLARSIPVIKPFGHMAGIVDVAGDLSPARPQNITLHLVTLQRLTYKLDEIRSLIERRQLVPVVDSVMPLAEVAEAHRRLETGGVRGKIVLEVVSE